ncbi:3-methyl-2-oxobutanoate hydroxymethyltransferase [Tepidibacillus infernus]|uniref:3-methyl-2-oxobutanoate hydroxymethyltransferase n=1 Tax=Tepidibacillus decaturensis TaxID=1413211 RepID=A0A135L674_9BACI|nr:MULTISPECIES: 3-methyl-2-oxobutanoate hydroxymethyltransferase [Tepidibacillus]KXG44419.1 3-methyl-2-oxobutanoate hydroxymethyltransferase [Tepidibacillus decaturensis]GBF10599.1 3-methyl-2-oxobutanoate hydroxymethyltransferase [Tepidibacillus sp. HK-1]
MKKRNTIATFRKMKQEGQKITMLTAYDYPTAKLLDQSGIDGILVGDSLGMVVLGYENTTQVTMEDMIHHIKAVSRAVDQALVIGDMPFLSYHMGIKESVKNAGRIIQEGHAQAVKLEGGIEIIEEIKAIIRAGIPVMGHLGFTPQSIHQMGGYYVQGKTENEARKLLEDAKALEDAGVFSLVLEMVPAELATMISSQLSIPVIGIGAGVGCDGQVLVTHDLLGFYHGNIPKFVKQYAEIGQTIKDSVSQYIKEVKQGTFPREEHCFHSERISISQLYGGK